MRYGELEINEFDDILVFAAILEEKSKVVAEP